MGLWLNVGARASFFYFLFYFYVFTFQGHQEPSKGNEQRSDHRLLWQILSK